MIIAALQMASVRARHCLVLGLLAGLFLPQVAAAMAPWLPQMVAALLVVTALRIGHRAALGALGDLGRTVLWVLGLQLALPLVLFGVLAACGQGGSTAALVIVLVTAAPALSGSPNLALMLGLDGGKMMQILILGTAAFPVTVLPVLLLMPQLGTAAAVLAAAGQLLAVIAVSAGVGFALRARFFPAPTAGQLQWLDGLSVLAFSGIVVGLMAALAPALAQDPAAVAGWMALAFGLCYGLQFAVQFALRPGPMAHMSGPIALAAGNRNIALFLVALPPEALTPIMVFVACWQVPMYLTPLILKPLYYPKSPA